MPVNSRQKGKRGELEAVKVVKEHWPFPDARRSQQFCGAEGDADLAETGDFHVEVKRYKRHACLDYLRQAEEDATDGQTPIVLLRENRDREWAVMFRIKDTQAFIDAINEAQARLQEAA